ncbi:MAG: transporter [Acidobacteriota bacterium]|nr:transporter [Acidobacteriota bacterium]
MQRPPKNRAARFSFACIALFVPAVLVTPALGQVRGMYSPGSTLTGAGTLATSGFSYSNQLWSGAAGELKGPNGEVLPLQTFVTIYIDNNTITYVSKFKFVHARLEFSVDIAFASGRFSLRDPFVPGLTEAASAVGLTNTTFVPFGLGWQWKHADFQTSYAVSAPTGRYTPGASNNLNSGYWTNFLQTGATIYLNKSRSTQISLFNVYAWNTTQQGTGIHPGQNDSLDYSLSRTFPLSKSGNWSLLAGAAGYGQWQTTDNSGLGPIRDSLKYRVTASGFTLELNTPYKGFSLGTGLLWEYGARNTFQGRTMTITAGFQL